MFSRDRGRARNPQQFRLSDAGRFLPRSRCTGFCTEIAAKARPGERTPRLAKERPLPPRVLERMMKPEKTKPELPRGRPGKKIDGRGTHQPTVTEFERKGLGIAPKE
jgi:hypothetical protein